jgi:hypothetical protein
VAARIERGRRKSEGVGEGWVPSLWLSLHSESVHANYVARGGGGIKETWAQTRFEQDLCFTQLTRVGHGKGTSRCRLSRGDISTDGSSACSWFDGRCCRC